MDPAVSLRREDPRDAVSREATSPSFQLPAPLHPGRCAAQDRAAPQNCQDAPLQLPHASCCLLHLCPHDVAERPSSTVVWAAEPAPRRLSSWCIRPGAPTSNGPARDHRLRAAAFAGTCPETCPRANFQEPAQTARRTGARPGETVPLSLYSHTRNSASHLPKRNRSWETRPALPLVVKAHSWGHTGTWAACSLYPDL